MEVIIDKQPYLSETLGDNLIDILSDLNEQVLGEDRVIGEVKINGQVYVLADMGPAEDMAREDIQTLEVDTIAARDMALHFLSNGPEYLRAIIASTEQVSELFRVADEKDANEQYVHTLESLQLFMQVLHSSREALGLDFARIQVEGGAVEQRLERLSVLIQEMLSAQEQEDWVLLADILQYDLGEELTGWSKVLPVLREQAVS